MGVGSGVQGGRVPLDFHAWYKYILDRGLIVLFFGLFSILRPFLPLPPLPPWKFSADALG